MTSLKATIKRASLALAFIVGAAQAAPADSFSVKRGLNLDIWTTWPEEARWGDRAALLPYPEWRRTIDRSDLQRLREIGFDFVRIPVDPAPFLSEKAVDLRDDLLDEIHQTIQFVRESGLKAIVDLHLIPAGPNRSIGMEQVMQDDAMFDRYVDLVRQIAGRLRNEDPTQVALEPMNEPIVDCPEDGTTLWPERQKRLHAAARAAATRLPLILTGACYSSAEGLAALKPADYPDDNLLWTFHSYQPFLLTHQGATWAGDFIRYVTGLSYPLSAMSPSQRDAALDAIRARIRAEAPLTRRAGMLAYLDEQIATMDTPEKLSALMAEPFVLVADWAKREGIAPERILLGEFGIIRQEYGGSFVMPASSRASYVGDMIALAERHGFSWSIWSYGGAFGVVESFSGERAEPDVLDLIGSLPKPKD